MGKRIVVIDDSSTVRRILSIGLGREGFTVECFPDGVEAFKHLLQPNTPAPDLFILDLVLPKMDGYEIARNLREKPQFSHIPIVMLTRKDGIIDRLKGRLAGAKAYITKPFKVHMVIEVITEQLNAAAAGPHLSQTPIEPHHTEFLSPVYAPHHRFLEQ